MRNKLNVLDERTRFSLPPSHLTYRGYEHKNFCNFRREFTSYILSIGAQTESRRLEILQSVLQGPALAYFLTEVLPVLHNQRDKENTPFSVTTALDLLQDYYVTEYDRQRYRDIPKTLSQQNNESSRPYLGRLRQAAHEADIKDKEQIQPQFNVGLLLRDIRRHCTRLSVLSHKHVLQKAEGYWNAGRNYRPSKFNNMKRRNDPTLYTMGITSSRKNEIKNQIIKINKLNFNKRYYFMNAIRILNQQSKDGFSKNKFAKNSRAPIEQPVDNKRGDRPYQQRDYNNQNVKNNNYQYYINRWSYHEPNYKNYNRDRSNTYYNCDRNYGNHNQGLKNNGNYPNYQHNESNNNKVEQTNYACLYQKTQREQ